MNNFIRWSTLERLYCELDSTFPASTRDVNPGCPNLATSTDSFPTLTLKQDFGFNDLCIIYDMSTLDNNKPPGIKLTPIITLHTSIHITRDEKTHFNPIHLQFTDGYK